MSFFTTAGVARFALERGYYGLWRTVLFLDGPSLAAADQLAAAAASRSLAMWPQVKMVYADMLDDQTVLQAALEGAAKGDNVHTLQDIFRYFGTKHTCDRDRVFAVAAEHASRESWVYAYDTLGWRFSAAAVDRIVDCALVGADGEILDRLVRDCGLPERYRTRIMHARNLRDAVRTKNPNYIREVVQNARCLKAEDMRDAELFARRTRNTYLEKQVIHPALDHAIGDWAVYNRQLVKGKVETVRPLLRAA